MITTGTDPLAAGTNDNPLGGVDLVVMDDFLYSEPTAAAIVPEPATWALLCAGMRAKVCSLEHRRTSKGPDLTATDVLDK
jgi:hypothetical protein